MNFFYSGGEKLKSASPYRRKGAAAKKSEQEHIQHFPP